MNKQDMINKSFHTVVVGARLPTSTFNLLARIGKATKLSKSMLIRAAVSQWLKNAPADLPIELKIAIAHQLMHDNIETIKQLRWIYYAAHDAKLKIESLYTSEKTNFPPFPPHVKKTLKQLERNIIAQQNQLDTWLEQQVSMRSNDTDVQNVNTDNGEP